MTSQANRPSKQSVASHWGQDGALGNELGFGHSLELRNDVSEVFQVNVSLLVNRVNVCLHTTGDLGEGH